MGVEEESRPRRRGSLEEDPRVTEGRERRAFRETGAAPAGAGDAGVWDKASPRNACSSQRKRNVSEMGGGRVSGGSLQRDSSAHGHMIHMHVSMSISH